MSTDSGVTARVAEAREAARKGENEVNASSALRLAVLKTWPPARLMRLGRDPDLTDADQKELQNFIANCAKPVGRQWSVGSLPTEWIGSFKGWWGWRSIAVSGTIILVVIALFYGYQRTPADYQLIEQGATVLIGDESGPSEQVTFQPKTVIRLGPLSPNGRGREISFWISGKGYRSAIYYADQPAR